MGGSFSLQIAGFFLGKVLKFVGVCVIIIVAQQLRGECDENGNSL
jgi:hypothetical protein